MTKATVVKWLKNENDQVRKGEPIVQIETEKVSHKIESPEDGVLLKIITQPKKVVSVGSVIAYIGHPGEIIPEVAQVTVSTSAATVQGAQRRIDTMTAVPSAPSAARPARASPRAKRLATEKGVDVANIVGSGPDGMIMENDILKYLETSVYRTRQGLRVSQVIGMSPTRKAIGENMASSLQSMAQVTLTTEVDAFQLQALRSALSSSKTDIRLIPTYTDILVKIVANVIEEHPIINSTLEDDQIKIVEEINIGVAVGLDTGLVVPVLRDANKKNLNEISAAIRDLVEKAKGGNLTLDNVVGSTFTVTNLGTYGVDAFTPIINPPQSAILGAGQIVEKPGVSEGKIVVRPTMVLSLTFDHKVMDGHVAAAFLKSLKERLESQKLMEDLMSRESR